MKKELFFVSLFTLSLISCGGTSQIQYTFYEDFTCSVGNNTSFNGKDIVIPSQVEMGGNLYTVTFIQENAFLNNKSIRNLTLPETVTIAGYDAFKGCTRLESVNFSNGMETIPDHMFQGCKSLKSITGTNNVKTIYNGAFESCNLTSVEFINLESIGLSNFFNNPNLKEVKLGGTLNLLPGSSFELCPKLESIILPASCTNIGEYAFKNCEKLSDFDFSNINYVSRNSFENCNISKVDLKNTAIELNAFINNDSLSEVNLDTCFISYRSFYDSDNLKKVSINNCLNIGSQSFASCAIESLTITGSVETIESEAFMDNKINNLSFGSSSIKTIHRKAFYNNPLVNELTIPSSVEKVYYQAFGKSNIEKVHVSSNTILDSDVFDEDVEIIYS